MDERLSYFDDMDMEISTLNFFCLPFSNCFLVLIDHLRFERAQPKIEACPSPIWTNIK